MRKLILLALMLPLTLSAQECWDAWSDGQTFHMTSKMWANTLPTTVKKWEKKKPAERAKLIAELNEQIATGEAAPWRTTEASFQITDLLEADGVYALGMASTDPAMVYATTNYCYQDTMYLVRNADIVYSIYQGDTLGLAVQGVQRIPTKLKVGDRLPAYKDYTITIPKTWDAQMTERVLAFSYTTSSVKTGHHTDTRTGESGFGKYKETQRHDVYDLIKHKVQVTEQIKGLTIHYMGAVVTAQEPIKVGGTSYDAYVIESASWTKNDVIRNYEAERADLAARKKAYDDKMLEKAKDKYWQKSGYLNDAGYVVAYRKEWFVPGMGVVQTEQYDNMGVIQVRMTLALNGVKE